jgi:hypothetical protein
MNRRGILSGASALGLLALPHAMAVPTAPEVQVFKSPYCGCCAAWVAHMKAAGFTVRVAEVHNAAVERRRLGMPDRYGSCHTATVGGYVIEGHVPADDVRRLLATMPKAIGLSVPGMPATAPGMEVTGRTDPFQVLLVDAAARSSVFATHRK